MATEPRIFAIQDCETGRIGVARELDPESQEFVIMFWISEPMIQEAADHMAAARLNAQS